MNNLTKVISTETDQNYKFKFSIIMSVYKVEEFIREAIDSIIAQDIGFAESVQIILVDDGSPDGSGAICDEYAARYPENILVIHKENGGLSSARNEGLKYIEGRYVNFFDPDDILTPNSLSEVYSFFIKNDKYIDMVAIPMYYFDAKEGDHPTNKNKFNHGNRVINLKVDYTLIQNSVASSFIRHDVAKNMRFDPDLCAMEDSKALMEFLIHNPRYGVVPGASYMYRQRLVGATSLSHGALRRKNWYNDFINRFSLSVIGNCLDKLGYVPKFVQAVLLYDLQWKAELESIPYGVLTPEEEEEFRNLYYSVFNYIDDDALIKSAYYYNEYKTFILSKKYNKKFSVDYYSDNVFLSIGDSFSTYLSNLVSAKFEVLTVKDNSLRVELTINIPELFFDGYEIGVSASVNSDQVISARHLHSKHERVSLGARLMSAEVYEFTLPLTDELFADEKCRVEFYMIWQGHPILLNRLTFSDFAAVSTKYKNQYCVAGDFILTMDENVIAVSKKNPSLVRKHERAFLSELWHSNKLGERKAVAVRLIYSVLKKFKKRKIHLLTDRINKADDNGEAMYDYYRSNKALMRKLKINYYYILDPASTDYKRLKSRHLVPVYSFKHKMLHLLSDYVLSSHSDNYVNKPMYTTYECYRDLTHNQRFVFLQHGITQNDISGWLNRYNKNIFGFVTAARPESESLLRFDYFYSEENVWQEGFARFDRLYRDEKRYITLMPTWRKYLMNGCDMRTGIWRLGDSFRESKYFKFYNSLINDERLLAACREKGYKLCFMPHPNIIPHIDVFDRSDEVKFFGIDTNYRTVYAESNMILTDYSSAAFDFAYLRKPLAYMHFDYDEFFSGEHVATPGYFSYENDGFGEVTKTVEETVDLIISYMNEDFAMRDKYRRRTDAFFAYSDKNNRSRILNRIVAADNKNP